MRAGLALFFAESLAPNAWRRVGKVIRTVTRTKDRVSSVVGRGKRRI